ncbi:Dephospho-CoA kinase (Dephosphocoenzyme A kinase) (COAE) [Dimargaris cristalligena]|uniref:Cytochrome c oxidase assembly protein PET191 n=1 Tax=Dimargaris cristalligena TaxID=215637 RepID=A0A4Q0A247_9FUNG|nr:Dephospho-CoA kinase (Dephosphocoenzyme A kinase) (COAE) [Dimargaris cristalligena]RKP39888.1 cytochrome c oxidase assembly protein PET191 [Dimargaris cristalligena]|eukprot:RKP39888.1 cytochrome c oxidase assembly protein PET191 [Dimargaris cristalligena]
MPTTCQAIRESMIECILKTDCVRIQKHTVKECLQKPELTQTLPEDCQAIRRSFVECKRSLLDMRRRFRGPKAH